ncbi:MAG: RadC family protein [Oscillospiraceae bacterium]|nr:RadC family protein [Oscillospiraceae bacterium]
MSIHSGHRERLREKFLNGGLSAFNEHEKLELLLTYCIPRKDVNEIAHLLINRFGSLLQVLQAPEKELMTVAGVGASVACFLRLMNETHRYLCISQATSKPQMHSYRDYGEYLVSFFIGKRVETVYLLCMDAKGEVIGCYLVSEGSVVSANISIRKLLEIAINCNAATVVLAHNHPGGFAVPSREDKVTTKQIAKALSNAEIVLADHIIVADDDFVSMVQSNAYDPDEI